MLRVSGHGAGSIEAYIPLGLQLNVLGRRTPRKLESRFSRLPALSGQSDIRNVSSADLATLLARSQNPKRVAISTAVECSTCHVSDAPMELRGPQYAGLLQGNAVEFVS